MATHSSILAWRIPMNRGAWPAIVHGVPKSQTQLSDQAQHMLGIQQWADGGSYLASFNMTVVVTQILKTVAMRAQKK